MDPLDWSTATSSVATTPNTVLLLSKRQVLSLKKRNVTTLASEVDTQIQAYRDWRENQTEHFDFMIAQCPQNATPFAQRLSLSRHQALDLESP